MSNMKIITISEGGEVKEEVLANRPPLGGVSPFRFKVGDRMITSLREAALTTAQFPTLLQDGLRAILFDAYNGLPTTWEAWCDFQPSDKQNEDYLRGSSIGLLPKVHELEAYSEIDVDLDDTVKVSNHKYGAIMKITEEMIRFDKTNIIRQMPQQFGEAAKRTLESLAYGVLSTAALYTASATVGLDK